MTGIGHGGKNSNNCILTKADLLLPKKLFKSCLVWFWTAHLVGFPSSLGKSKNLCDVAFHLKIKPLTSEAK